MVLEKNYFRFSIIFIILTALFYLSLNSTPAIALCAPVDGCCINDPLCPAGNSNCQGACPAANCQPTNDDCRGGGGACKSINECQGTWCGDDTCNGGETCNTCPGDCGTCDPCVPNPCPADGTPTGFRFCSSTTIMIQYYDGTCSGNAVCGKYSDPDVDCAGAGSSPYCGPDNKLCTKTCSNGNCVDDECPVWYQGEWQCGPNTVVCSGDNIVNTGDYCYGNPGGAYCHAGGGGVQQNCNDLDSWHDVGGNYPCCIGSGTSTCRDQQFWNYTCTTPPVQCSYTVTQTRTINLTVPVQCPVLEDTCINSNTLRNYTVSSCSAGACQNPYVDVFCPQGCVTQPGPDICQPNPPPVVQPINYTGTCNSGQTITLLCNASDPNQQANTLNVKVWAGNCTTPNCFDTRNWIYYANSPMNPPASGGMFTKTLTITSPPGTPIAATCQATDSFGAPSNFGDAYPLCITNSCQFPPSAANIAPMPDPVNATSLRIVFQVSRPVQTPTVTIQPGYQTNPTGPQYPAVYNFTSSNNYFYDVNILQGYTNGHALVRINLFGLNDSCYGSGVKDFIIDTIKPVTSITCDNVACQPSYTTDQNITVRFPCSDATTSCAWTKYTVNGGAEVNYNPGSPFKINRTGQYNFTYYSRDSPGNYEIPKIMSINYLSTAGCQGVSCNLKDDECIGPNTLKDYTDAYCADGSCVDVSNNVQCPYGCLVIPGPDICDPTAKPILTELSAQGQYQNYVRTGGSVTMLSVGYDPGGQNIRLKCGTTKGSSNLCTSSYVIGNPFCSFNAPWANDGTYVAYCFLENAAGGQSLDVLGAGVVVDNSPPYVYAAVTPGGPYIPPGSQVGISAISGDDGSGVAGTEIKVNNIVVATCQSQICSYTFTPAYGRYDYVVTATDHLGMQGDVVASFAVDTPPDVLKPITYSGQCITGGTITLTCEAADREDPSSALLTTVWAGQCTANDCFDTRNWIYYNGAPMNYASGPLFTKQLVINQPSGTGVAATCRTTDTLGIMNEPETQGDMYPICVVDGCQNPPDVTIDSILPSPTGIGEVTIRFTSDVALAGNPTVTVTPGYEIGGTDEYQATQVSQNGNSYVYSFVVLTSYLDGDARVKIHVNAQADNCPLDKMGEFIIDKKGPAVNVICNGQICKTNKVYRSPVFVGFDCIDGESRCTTVSYGINGPPIFGYDPTSPPVLTETGVYNVSYLAKDIMNNTASGTQKVRVYKSPCKEGGSGCIPIDEEARVVIRFDQPTVLEGQPITTRLYCFLRDMDDPEFKTRDCDIDPSTLTMIVDQGMPKEVSYFDKIGMNPTEFLNAYTETPPEPVPLTVDSYFYQIDKYVVFDVDTNLFRSTFDVSASDIISGLGGSDTASYVISNSQINVEVNYPGLTNGIIPPTISGAPNFTKLMPITFHARPIIVTQLTANVCKDVNCRVEFNFVPFEEWDYLPPTIAPWSGFDEAYVPELKHVSSTVFACNSYYTLYVRATKQGGQDSGIVGENQSDFFVNCDTKLTVNPIEVRLAVGERAGKLFDVTLWNPTDDVRIFELESTTSNPNGFPLPWINLECSDKDDCEVGPVGGDFWLTTDDRARITALPLSSKTLIVNMPVAVKSGSYPVSFVATDTSSGDIYSAAGNILVFSEGLSEFSNVQLVGLVVIAVAVVVYYSTVFAKKPVVKRKKKR